MPLDRDDTWDKCKLFVLEELKRVNEENDKLREDLEEVRSNTNTVKHAVKAIDEIREAQRISADCMTAVKLDVNTINTKLQTWNKVLTAGLAIITVALAIVTIILS